MSITRMDECGETYTMKEAARLQTKVDELERRNELLEEANTRQGVVALSLATQCDTLQESEAALKVMVERLRNALIEAHTLLNIERGMNTQQAKIHSEVLCPKTNPAQSLTTHNQKIERETIERIVNIIDTAPQSGITEMIDAIRSLPTIYGETNEN